MKKTCTAIRASDRAAEILIYEEIGEGFFGGLGAKAFRQQITALKDVDTITVRINSPGGDVFEGVAIYNTLKDHPATKNVVIDGVAASIATVIAMAGDTITIQPTAMMMIHNAVAVVRGDGNGLREVADLLDTISGQMATAYQRSGMSIPAIRQIMDAETWYTAEAAVAAGWADSLVAKPLKMAASLKGLHLEGFKHVPEWVKAAQAGSAASDDCTCSCDPCVQGNCESCDHENCDCAGCDCPQNISASAAKTAANALKTAETERIAMLSARIRAENLRLAEL